jgi:AbrB family looped-hinge helix DNA binding protein
MVNSVEYRAVVDKQGRLVLPAKIRAVLGIKNGGRVRITLKGDKLMITVFDEDLESRVNRWHERLSSISIEPFTEEISREVSKWYSEEYARRKLGL